MSIPTLVVGLGGTGVLTLRALKRLYMRLDPKERVPCEFLGIDCDRSNLNAEDWERELAELRDDEFLFFSPKAMQDVMANLERTEDGRLVWERVLQWLPDPSEVRIPTSDVEANGASQMRALGRLGLFLNDEIINAELHQKLDALPVVVDEVRLVEDKRVILISSIAGGTGAGLLVDLAYLARRHASRPRVFAYLLLPEVFERVDTGRRIFQNAYACLKELAFLKDQQIRFTADYYRIPPINIAEGGEEPFARIFLFDGADPNSRNPILGAVRKISACVLGQLERTVQEKSLSIVSNALSADSADEQHRRRTHCFSACSTSFIELTQVGNIRETISSVIAKALQDPEFSANTFEDELRRQLDDVRSRLEGTSPITTEKSIPSNTVNSEQDLSELISSLVENWVKRFRVAAAHAAGTYLTELRAKLDKAGSEAMDPVRVTVAMSHLEEISKVVEAEYTEERYEQNLANLKAAASFQKEDEDLKNEIRSTLGLSIASGAATAEVKHALDTRRLLAEFRKQLGQFRATFQDASSEQMRERRRKVIEERSKLAKLEDAPWWTRLLWIPPGAMGKQVLALHWHDVLAKAVEDPTLKENIQNIFHARMSRALRAEVETADQRAESRLERARSIWVAAVATVPASAMPERLAKPLLAAAADFLIKELPRILAETSERILDDDIPEVRWTKLLNLLDERLATDPRLSGVTAILESDQKSAERSIYRALVKTRQGVFVTRTPNRQRQGYALVMIPAGLLWPAGDRAALHRFLESASKQILNSSQCQVLDYKGSRIWIYHEELFNPPSHLRNIDEYYRQYSAQPHRELFHIDRRFLQDPVFVDIVIGKSAAAIGCGNPGCRQNIVGHPRTDMICPGCGRLILSRCGNKDCTLEGLDRMEERNDLMCPVCRGFNHAAWWCCRNHGTLPAEISTQKERCPRCIEEHQHDPVAWPISKISVRPDLRHRLVCPNCEEIARNKTDYAPFIIPAKLVRFYRDGVNGHDREDFLRLARELHLPDNCRCPRCRALLIPIHHHNLTSECGGRTAL